MIDSEVARRHAQEMQLQAGLSYFHGLTMLPFLREGDLVKVAPVEWSEIRLGDVLTYRFEDKYPTRRVVRIDRGKNELILKGDSIPGHRPYYVARADVLGKAVSRLRDGIWLHEHQWPWKLAMGRAMVREWLYRLHCVNLTLRRHFSQWLKM